MPTYERAASSPDNFDVDFGRIQEMFITQMTTQTSLRMSNKPKCIIVTGRPGSGKTTLARKLAEQLWMPIISRDAIKEGYVNTYGVKHDQLPPDTNMVVSNRCFEIVNQHLAGEM